MFYGPGSLPTARHGALALNYKVTKIAQRNVNSGFTRAKSLAAAKNLPGVVEVQAAYRRN